jgi:DNA-binding NarL/FixJ family response regulator
MRALHPQLPVVVVSAREEPTVMRRALDHGAFGFIPKSADSDTIGQAMATILDGETLGPAGGAGNVPPIGREEREVGQRLRDLTPQQFRVLQMLGARAGSTSRSRMTSTCPRRPSRRTSPPSCASWA